MPIHVNCSGCGKSFHVADELGGKHIKCPGCEAVLAVGKPATKSESPPRDENPFATDAAAASDPAGSGDGNSYQSPTTHSPKVSQGASPQDQFAIASLVCGVCGLSLSTMSCCCMPFYLVAAAFAIGGVICGILGKDSSNQVMAYAGIACSAVTLLLGMGWIVFVVLNISLNAANG